MMWRVADQIAKKAQEQGPGILTYTTENSYPELSDVHRVFGGGSIRTETKAQVIRVGDFLVVEGRVKYEYEDMFTDPRNIREEKYGTSSIDGISEEEIRKTDLGGTYYKITGSWTTKIMTGTRKT